MNDIFQYKYELLKQEIDTLQSGIKTYDGILFTIKGWAITVFSGFIFFTADKRRPIFLIFCAMSVLLFWLLDSIYKNIQKVYTRRYIQLEEYLQSDNFIKSVESRSFQSINVPDISSGFNIPTKDKYKGIFREAVRLHNNLLYIAMLVLIAGLAVVLRRA